MRIDQVPPRARVFVDANVFLYHLADASPGCSSALEQVERKQLVGFTSLLVLEEVLFRRLVAEAVIGFGWGLRGAVNNLRLHPEVVKKLVAPWQEVRAFSSLVAVIEPRLSDLLGSQDIQERYGIFGSDAISAFLMKRANIAYVATADQDFDRLDFAQRIEVETA
jgi:predicted nucleic acid-binding protein